MQRLAITALSIALGLAAAAPARAGGHKTYVIQKGDTPIGVAKKFRVSVDELLRFNGMSPNDGFRAGEKIEIPFKGEVTGKTYVVEAGDSVASIADFHGVSQNALRAANGMRKGDVLRIGEEIKIPHGLRGGASRSHVVRKGDTLASIAKRYKVSVKNLAAENKLKTGESIRIGRTLIIPDEDDDPGRYRPAKTDKLVETGEKVPNGVLHTVQPGQSLWIIARAYNSKGATIARVNGFSTDEPLSVGRKILIPGAKEVVPVRVKGYVVQPIRFVRVWNDKKATVRLMTRSGKVSPYGRKVLSRLAASKTGRRRVKLLHPRLIHMIQRVAERWPGQTIEIISGYRPNQTGTESKHSQGRAIDFRVAGVSNRDLYEFCTQLPKSGCGYYPNSVFIHMDARDRSTTWTDYSGPGEGARYSKKKGGGSAGSDREEIADAEREGD